MSTKTNPISTPTPVQGPRVSFSFFERYLTLWVFLCIIAGIVLGRVFPGIAVTLDAMSVYQVSIPIAICLFFMMYPIMVKGGGGGGGGGGLTFPRPRKRLRPPKPSDA